MRVLGGDRVAAGTTKVVAGLLRDADVAMYAAKDGGKRRVVAYTDGMTDSIRRRSNLQQDLKQAVDDGQVSVAYQPIVDMGAEQVTGYEALARWHHPTAGTISPAEFVDWAEADGTIIALGAFVLDRAVESAARWGRDLDRPVGMAVNVSPTQLTSPGWVDSVVEVLGRHGLPAGRLTLEITENVVATDAERAIDVLAELRGHGVRIAIDDFGTGFSNLAYLRRLPTDVIKIDRSFVADIDTDPTTATLVSSMIQLAASMDLDVIAEGVETAEQRRTLTLMGCARAQGFLFARPEPEPQHQLVTQVVDSGGLVPTSAPQVTTVTPVEPEAVLDPAPAPVGGAHRLSHYLPGPTSGVRAQCSCGFLTAQAVKRAEALDQLRLVHGLDRETVAHA